MLSSPYEKCHRVYRRNVIISIGKISLSLSKKTMFASIYPNQCAKYIFIHVMHKYIYISAGQQYIFIDCVQCIWYISQQYISISRGQQYIFIAFLQYIFANLYNFGRVREGYNFYVIIELCLNLSSEYNSRHSRHSLNCNVFDRGISIGCTSWIGGCPNDNVLAIWHNRGGPG